MLFQCYKKNLYRHTLLQQISMNNDLITVIFNFYVNGSRNIRIVIEHNQFSFPNRAQLGKIPCLKNENEKYLFQNFFLLEYFTYIA